MVFRLTIAYRGGEFAGWQRQPAARTVQGVLEAALGELVREPVTLVAASRTDAGVHARGQEAHCELAREFPARALVHGTNRRLPGDVRVLAARRMPDGFHARKHAAAKEYRYRLLAVPVLPPVDEPFSVRVAPGIDRGAMAAALAALPGEHDFSAFALAGGAHRQPRRRILVAEWLGEGPELVLRLVGAGFLRGMVRGLVGTLVEVGRRRRRPEEFSALLAGGPRGAAGPTAPARGLVLERVLYPPAWEG